MHELRLQQGIPAVDAFYMISFGRSAVLINQLLHSVSCFFRRVPTTAFPYLHISTFYALSRGLTRLRRVPAAAFSNSQFSNSVLPYL
jgi:hypothetical protein